MHTPGSLPHQIHCRMHSKTMVNIVGARWLLTQPALKTLSYDTCVSKTTERLRLLQEKRKKEIKISARENRYIKMSTWWCKWIDPVKAVPKSSKHLVQRWKLTKIWRLKVSLTTHKLYSYALHSPIIHSTHANVARWRDFLPWTWRYKLYWSRL